MARYKLILAYDGTDFSGFQRQKSVRTVQETVEKALRAIGWSGSSILAAGRTDTGVHAAGQVIAFDMEWRHPVEDLLNALNANLPPDAVAREAYLAEHDFHPRFHAVSRTYRYHLVYEQVRNPFEERFAWRLWPPLPLAALNTAANELVGEHDFKAFGTPPIAGGSSIRKVVRSECVAEQNRVIFTVEANAFLYHMVRRIVRLLVDTASGQVGAGRVRDHLSSGGADPVVGLAPPRGLVLASVQYPDARI